MAEGGPVTSEEDKAWFRALPLLFLGGLLFAAGTLVFWNKGDATASIASMTLGVVLMTTWMVMEVIRIHEERKRRKKDEAEGQIT
jgi:hypothetical protein